MKRLSVLLAATCLLTSASAQRLEPNMYLPDSAGGVVQPQSVVANSAGTRFFVGGSSPGVAALDASTGARRFRFDTGSDVCAICENPVLGKVYAASMDDNTVTAADASSGETRGVIEVGTHPWALALNAAGSRLFVACLNDSTVYEIDCNADTVWAVHRVGNRPYEVIFNPANGLVYTANQESRSVSIIGHPQNPRYVRTVFVDCFPTLLECNPRENKVYCAGYNSPLVSVISGATHRVIAEVPVGTGPAALCFDSAANEVYCANGGSRNIAVVDGAENRVTAMVVLDDAPQDIVFDPATRRAFCLSDHEPAVLAIDAATRRVVGRLALPREMTALSIAPQAGRLALTDEDRSATLLVDCAGLTAVARTQLGLGTAVLQLGRGGGMLWTAGAAAEGDSMTVVGVDCASNVPIFAFNAPFAWIWCWAACYNDAEDKLYLAGPGGEVLVIDAAAGTALRTIPLGGPVYALDYAPAENKVYASGGRDSGYVAAICGRDDTLLGVIRLPYGAEVACHNPTRNTIYAFAGSAPVYWVIDCAGDTVVGEFEGGRNTGCALYNPLSDKIYSLSYTGTGTMLVIDGVTHAIRARVDVGNGANSLCLDRADNLVFASAMAEGAICAVDGLGDSLLERLEFEEAYVGPLAYDPDHNVVYAGHAGWYGRWRGVVLLDGATRREVGRIVLGADEPVGEHFVVSQLHDRMYASVGDYSCIRVIRTGAGAIATPGSAARLGTAPAATLVRGVLNLAPDISNLTSGIVLLDAAGRRVLALKPGPNDVSHLAPGVYFVVAKWSSGLEVRRSSEKVVVAR
jgi:YVTN family beta-propeller protein